MINAPPDQEGATSSSVIYLRRGWLLCLPDDNRTWSPARSAEHHIDLTGPTARAADLSSMTTSCTAFCVMTRSEEEDDTAAADAAAERASSMMRKWDLPPRLLCVYHYSNGSASKADGADVTYPQPSSEATPLLVVLEEQQLARLLCYTSSPEAIQGTALPEWEHRAKEGVCVREKICSV